MGFLSGAYGKLMAGKLVRDIQYRMTSVQSRLRRITREIDLKTKMYQSQDRNMKFILQQQMQNFQQNAVLGVINNGGYQLPNGATISINEAQANQLGMLSYMGYSAMSGSNISNLITGGNFGTLDSTVSTLYSTIQQQAQMQYATSQTLYQNFSEMQKEADLEALKDEEEDLQTEKDNLESQLQIAKAEYDAKKEEEKDGAKNLAPNYTGQ
jgi:hypothetical protein